MALTHHERIDGTGYPRGLAGEEIPIEGRIAAVADVFDALTSDRYYRRALALHEGYDYVVERSGRDFDPEVVEIFQSFVAPFPPGTPVVLSDGHSGVVVEAKQHAVRTPVVRLIVDPSGATITPHDIDLAQLPGLTVASTQFQMPSEAMAAR
jgi:HD-GYP domain-containing protein (c-di-GMP phosphodiesterase class II)